MNSRKSKQSGSAVEAKLENQSAESRLPDRGGASRAGGERESAEADAALSNTASDNCNLGSGSFFKALRWGVDSLYLSVQGDLHPEIQQRLKDLKKLAQSDADDQLAAQFPIGDHLFEVRDRSAGVFQFVLVDNAFRIQLARAGTKLPMAYVQVSAEYLAHVGPERAEIDLRQVLDQLGATSGFTNVSRIDLFVDFLTGDSLDVERRAWVTRAEDIATYALGEALTGWTVGMGGNIAARLYNKSLQAAKKGITWLYRLWSAHGWQEDQTVWRLEFQLERELLRQKGLASLADVLRHRDGLWSYATTEWLKLTVPSDTDQTRARWPIHPLWAYLASVDWESNGGPLTRKFSTQRPPSAHWIGSQGAAVLTALMAQAGTLAFAEGMARLADQIEAYLSDKGYQLGMPFQQCLEEVVRNKARRYNSLDNGSTEGDEAAKALTVAVKAYRKESGG